jgi:DNA-binding response OmpR family regulator
MTFGDIPPSGPPLRARICVLEDDREMATVVREALAADGHTVLSLAHGTVAVADILARQAASWEVPDLIVTDIRLPGYSGIQILETLRRSGCAIPAIVMSGFTSVELRARADELGIVAVFEKPFDMDDLRAAVRAHLRA